MKTVDTTLELNIPVECHLTRVESIGERDDNQGETTTRHKGYLVVVSSNRLRYTRTPSVGDIIVYPNRRLVQADCLYIDYTLPDIYTDGGGWPFMEYDKYILDRDFVLNDFLKMMNFDRGKRQTNRYRVNKSSIPNLLPKFLDFHNITEEVLSNLFRDYVGLTHYKEERSIYDDEYWISRLINSRDKQKFFDENKDLFMSIGLNGITNEHLLSYLWTIEDVSKRLRVVTLLPENFNLDYLSRRQKAAVVDDYIHELMKRKVHNYYRMKMAQLKKDGWWMDDSSISRIKGLLAEILVYRQNMVHEPIPGDSDDFIDFCIEKDDELNMPMKYGEYVRPDLIYYRKDNKKLVIVEVSSTVRWSSYISAKKDKDEKKWDTLQCDFLFSTPFIAQSSDRPIALILSNMMSGQKSEEDPSSDDFIPRVPERQDLLGEGSFSNKKTINELTNFKSQIEKLIDQEPMDINLAEEIRAYSVEYLHTQMGSNKDCNSFEVSNDKTAFSDGWSDECISNGIAIQPEKQKTGPRIRNKESIWIHDLPVDSEYKGKRGEIDKIYLAQPEVPKRSNFKLKIDLLMNLQEYNNKVHGMSVYLAPLVYRMSKSGEYTLRCKTWSKRQASQMDPDTAAKEYIMTQWKKFRVDTEYNLEGIGRLDKDEYEESLRNLLHDGFDVSTSNRLVGLKAFESIYNIMADIDDSEQRYKDIHDGKGNKSLPICTDEEFISVVDSAMITEGDNPVVEKYFLNETMKKLYEESEYYSEMYNHTENLIKKLGTLSWFNKLCKYAWIHSAILKCINSSSNAKYKHMKVPNSSFNILCKPTRNSVYRNKIVMYNETEVVGFTTNIKSAYMISAMPSMMINLIQIYLEEGYSLSDINENGIIDYLEHVKQLSGINSFDKDLLMKYKSIVKGFIKQTKNIPVINRLIGSLMLLTKPLMRTNANFNAFQQNVRFSLGLTTGIGGNYYDMGKKMFKVIHDGYENRLACISWAFTHYNLTEFNTPYKVEKSFNVVTKNIVNPNLFGLPIHSRKMMVESMFLLLHVYRKQIRLDKSLMTCCKNFFKDTIDVENEITIKCESELLEDIVATECLSGVPMREITVDNFEDIVKEQIDYCLANFGKRPCAPAIITAYSRLHTSRMSSDRYALANTGRLRKHISEVALGTSMLKSNHQKWVDVQQLVVGDISRITSGIASDYSVNQAKKTLLHLDGASGKLIDMLRELDHGTQNRDIARKVDKIFEETRIENLFDMNDRIKSEAVYRTYMAPMKERQLDRRLKGDKKHSKDRQKILDAFRSAETDQEGLNKVKGNIDAPPNYEKEEDELKTLFKLLHARCIMSLTDEDSSSEFLEDCKQLSSRISKVMSSVNLKEVSVTLMKNIQRTIPLQNVYDKDYNEVSIMDALGSDIDRRSEQVFQNVGLGKWVEFLKKHSNISWYLMSVMEQNEDPVRTIISYFRTKVYGVNWFNLAETQAMLNTSLILPSDSLFRSNCCSKFLNIARMLAGSDVSAMRTLMLENRSKLSKHSNTSKGMILCGEMITNYMSADINQLIIEIAPNIQRVTARIAAKNQLAGERELCILQLPHRLLFLCMEKYAEAYLSLYTNSPMVDKTGKDKLAEKAAEESKRNRDVYFYGNDQQDCITAIISGDQTKWGPSHRISNFVNMFSQVPSEKYRQFNKLWAQTTLFKDIQCPKGAMEGMVRFCKAMGMFKNVRFAKEGNIHERSKDLVKKRIENADYLEKEEKFLLNWWLVEGRCVIPSYLHMMQGIPHRISTMFADIKDKFFEDVVRYSYTKENIRIMDFTTASSSDDSITMLKVNKTLIQDNDYSVFNNLFRSCAAASRMFSITMSPKTIMDVGQGEIYSNWGSMGAVIHPSVKDVTQQIFNVGITSPRDVYESHRQTCISALLNGKCVQGVMTLLSSLHAHFWSFSRPDRVSQSASWVSLIGGISTMYKLDIADIIYPENVSTEGYVLTESVNKILDKEHDQDDLFNLGIALINSPFSRYYKSINPDVAERKRQSFEVYRSSNSRLTITCSISITDKELKQQQSRLNLEMGRSPLGEFMASTEPTMKMIALTNSRTNNYKSEALKICQNLAKPEVIKAWEQNEDASRQIFVSNCMEQRYILNPLKTFSKKSGSTRLRMNSTVEELKRDVLSWLLEQELSVEQLCNIAIEDLSLTKYGNSQFNKLREFISTYESKHIMEAENTKFIKYSESQEVPRFSKPLVCYLLAMHDPGVLSDCTTSDLDVKVIMEEADKLRILEPMVEDLLVDDINRELTNDELSNLSAFNKYMIDKYGFKRIKFMMNIPDSAKWSDALPMLLKYNSVRGQECVFKGAYKLPQTMVKHLTSGIIGGIGAICHREKLTDKSSSRFINFCLRDSMLKDSMVELSISGTPQQRRLAKLALSCYTEKPMFIDMFDVEGSRNSVDFSDLGDVRVIRLKNNRETATLVKECNSKLIYASISDVSIMDFIRSRSEQIGNCLQVEDTSFVSLSRQFQGSTGLSLGEYGWYKDPNSNCKVDIHPIIKKNIKVAKLYSVCSELTSVGVKFNTGYWYINKKNEFKFRIESSSQVVGYELPEEFMEDFFRKFTLTGDVEKKTEDDVEVEEVYMTKKEFSKAISSDPGKYKNSEVQDLGDYFRVIKRKDNRIYRISNTASAVDKLKMIEYANENGLNPDDLDSLKKACVRDAEFSFSKKLSVKGFELVLKKNSRKLSIQQNTGFKSLSDYNAKKDSDRNITLIQSRSYKTILNKVPSVKVMQKDYEQFDIAEEMHVQFFLQMLDEMCKVSSNTATSISIVSGSDSSSGTDMEVESLSSIDFSYDEDSDDETEVNDLTKLAGLYEEGKIIRVHDFITMSNGKGEVYVQMIGARALAMLRSEIARSEGLEVDELDLFLFNKNKHLDDYWTTLTRDEETEYERLTEGKYNVDDWKYVYESSDSEEDLEDDKTLEEDYVPRNREERKEYYKHGR
uniref:RNA-dependent RNA polymerase n=1 Tax=Wenling crustacean virus 8 TaxID=1923491 RepID=A0A1L3KPN9_9VIRU|nr:RNA-dependent RNA polymerase [Wenling crustacean virus 8]